MSNWMRDLKRVYSSVLSPTFAATAGNYMQIAIPGMPNEGVVLKRARIVGSGVSTTGSNYLDIKVLRDGGKYIEAETASAGSGEQYVVFAWNDQTSTVGPNTLWVSDVTFSDDVLYTDDLDSTNLYLRLEAPVGLSGHGVFRAEFWGDGVPRLNDYPSMDAKKDLAIRRWSVGNVWKDLHEVCSYPEHSLNSTVQHTMFSANTDYLYFGLEETFNGLWFFIEESNSIAGITATWEYYNGSTWAALTVRDNCKISTAISDVLFSSSGIIEWSVPSDWGKTNLSSLGAPLDGVVTPLSTYGGFPTGDDGGSRISRYWVRLKLDNITEQPKFRWIRTRPLV